MSQEAVSPPAGVDPIGIVILAAGGSTRMGQPKQLLPHRRSTLLRHTAEVALAQAGAPVVVVLGSHAEQVRPTLDGLPVMIAPNAGWHTGMGSSLRVGLSALLAAHPDLAAAIFLVCDQPLLCESTLADLIVAFRASSRPIVASAYADTLGVPALFAASHFPALLRLAGDEGARHLIQRNHAEVLAFPFPGGAIDLDTPADCEALSIPLFHCHFPHSS
jgi:molybdenum cofactor cytidylyltransferase